MKKLLLIATFELLRWNNSLQIFEYCRPDSLETLKGTFETYAILELGSGTTYAINGYLTEIYKPQKSKK
jgi:hypothetical protein